MDQVAQIREKIDIVSFISEFVTLKKAGRNFKANCPFHGEKTPSFMVSPDRQIWHCFGSCNKGGDIYSFLMEYEHIEFPEALRILAKRAGIELQNRFEDKGLTSKKEAMYRMNSLVRDFYHYILTKHKAGQKAREYLEKRGITEKVIETFQLGFAPSRGNALVKYLIDKKKYKKEDVLEAGLAFQGGRLIDFFRGRLIFPLIDHRDNVVGFAGRILESSENAPKYINTRETLVYHKGDMVYGLSITKEQIREKDQVVIVEGEFDVMSCFQNGISNVVGIKGTALTEQQVALLARFAKKVTFCFDGDKAGQEAIRRSLPIVEARDLTPTAIEIPGGKDPDEALRNEPGQFKKAAKEDIGIYDYLLERGLKEHDLTTAEGKKQLAATMLPFLSQIKNEIIKEHYLRKLSQELDTSYESIMKELTRHTQTQRMQIAKPTPKMKRSKEEILEEYLLSLVLQSEKPKETLEKVLAILSDSMSKERAYQKLMEAVFEHFQKHTTFDSKLFGDGLPQELVPAYERSLLFPLPQFSDDEKLVMEAEKTAKKLKHLYIQQKITRLASEIQEKEKNGEEDAVIELKKDYSSLVSLLE